MARKRSLIRRLFVPDTHAPWYDEKAYNVLLQTARLLGGVDELVFLGDFHECYSVSAHPKNPAKDWANLKDELDPGVDLFHRTINAAKPKKVVFLEGNHENRITRFIQHNAGKLQSLINIKEILCLPKNCAFYPYGQHGYHHCGPKLIATHGSITSKHHASIMLAKYGTSVIYGHTHTIQQHFFTNVHKQTLQAVSCGWLGDSKKVAEYIKNVPNWQQGFCIGYFKPDGKFFLEVVQIINGEAVFHGKNLKAGR